MAAIVEVLSSVDILIQRATTLVIEQLKTAITDRGIGTLVLSGGSTPKPLYAALAQASLPWEKIHFFWGDERYVPVEHPDSNQGMTRQVLLNHIPIPSENIHAMPTASGDPVMDAADHEAHLRSFFKMSSHLPTFDLILLGLGDDGHTASLFPYTDALAVNDRWVTVGNKDGQPRLTFTIPLINQARSILFLVAGANKQPALKAIFQDGDTELDRQYPARFIRPQGECHWLLDAAAGQAIQAQR
jgi:6-phosphogluconolactonase